jgi:hypothetical protein
MKNKYERAIGALSNSIFEAEEEHKKLQIRYSYRLSEEDIKDHEELINAYKEAITALKMGSKRDNKLSKIRQTIERNSESNISVLERQLIEILDEP